MFFAHQRIPHFNLAWTVDNCSETCLKNMKWKTNLLANLQILLLNYINTECSNGGTC